MKTLILILLAALFCTGLDVPRDCYLQNDEGKLKYSVMRWDKRVLNHKEVKV